MADKILNDEGLATFASEVKGYVNDTVKSANIANLDTLVFKNYYDSNAPIYNIFMQDNKIKLKSWNQTDDTVIPSMITGITAVPTDNSDVANKKYVDDAVSNSSGNIDLSAYAKTADLSTVATSGSYEDLTNKPTIPDVSGYLPLTGGTVEGKTEFNSDTFFNSLTAYGKSDFRSSVNVSGNLNFVGSSNTHWIDNLGLLFFKNGVALRHNQNNIGVEDNDDGEITLEYRHKVNGEYVSDAGQICGIATPYKDSHIANKKYVDDQIATVSGGSNVDLTGYATESWVEGKGYTTMTEVEAKGYLTAHQDLSTYALKSEIPTVPTKISVFENDKGYLTAHQSLANYALKSEIPSLTDYSTTAQVQEMISSAIGQIVDGNEVSY